MTKTSIKVSVPLEEYNELIEFKRIAEKLTAYVDGLGVSPTEKVKEFNVGDRVKIVGPIWNGSTTYIGRVGTVSAGADVEGDYAVDGICPRDIYKYAPPTSLELIEE